MSKVLKVVAKVAGVVAIVAATVATFGAATPAIAAAAAAVGSIAGAVATVAGTLSQALAKPPRARGSTSQILIGSNLPMPYSMGRTYVGGNLVYDVGFGGTVDKVPNPYRALTFVMSLGPIDSFEAFQADYATVSFSGSAATGYFGGFLWRASQLGATPEASALVAQFAGEPGWSTSHKLSGKAAVKWTCKFDKKGKVFASGLPQFGCVLKGVKVYDPRLDSTYPGGSGAHRIDNEATWAWSENPALHALAYALGRYQNGKKVFGVDLGDAAIDLSSVVAWANVCDTNSWKVGGTIFEPGDKWNNLKLICAAGSAQPSFTGGMLTFIFDAPRVQLDTVTIDDLAEGEVSVAGMLPWQQRLNSIVPKYRSEAHLWEMVPANAVTVSGYVTEDGEEKPSEIDWDLVQDVNQVARLAAYRLVNGRELGPISLPLKARFAEYRVGDGITVNLPEMGLASQTCVVIGRTPQPATGTFLFELVSETASKHAFALGQTGTAPPTPTLIAPGDMDAITFESGGILTERNPSTPPVEPPVGSLYIDADARQYRFEGRPLLFNGDPLLFNGDAIATSGYVDVQDEAIPEAAKTAIWSSIADDGAKPEDNADVTANAVPVLECPAAVALVADYLGVISTGQLPRVLNAVRKRGGADVSATTTWTIINVVGISAGTPTISTTGIVTIPNTLTMGANASFVVRSERDGVVLEQTIAISKTNASPPSTGGGGAGTTVQDSTFSGVSSTTFAAISDVMTVSTGSAGQIAFSAPLQTHVVGAPVDVFDVEIRWGYKLVGGGSYTYAAAVASNPDAETQDIGFVGEPAYENFPGAVTSNPVVTGLTANTDYEIVLEGKRTSAGPSQTVYFTGTASATGS